jgi:hypothetical protein
MHLLSTIFSALLFSAFVPGILFSIPPKGSKYLVLFTHATLFALVYHFAHKAIFHVKQEGFIEGGFWGFPSCRSTSPVCSPGVPNCSPPTRVCNDNRICPSPGVCFTRQDCYMQSGVCTPSPPVCSPGGIICN